MDGDSDRPSGAGRMRFGARHRLSGRRAFDAVFSARMQKGAGHLVVHAAPNSLDHWRLGLSVGRRVGGAVVRNRVKRRVREAFRQQAADLPRRDDGCYDLVVRVLPGAARAKRAELERLIVELAAAVHQGWTRRLAREADR